MKALHVIPSFVPANGGPAYAMRVTARALAKADVEVTIATTDGNGPARLEVPLGQPVTDEGFTVRYFPRQLEFHDTSVPLIAWLARHVRDYDLVHMHTLFANASLAAAGFAARQDVPYIVRPLGTLSRRAIQDRRPHLKQLAFHLVGNRVMRGAAAIHFTSEQECREAALLGNGWRSAVIPHGVEIPVFDRQDASARFLRAYPSLAGRHVILFLGRLHPIKGLDLLLPAFAQVLKRHPDTVLVLAGDADGSYGSQLQEVARELGLTNSIVWTGFLQGEEKLAALAAADLFVLPSYTENFGVAAVEAMGAGLPVILSDQVAVSREALQADAALVVRCDVGELAAALDRLIPDAALRRRLGANGPRAVQQYFSVDAMTCRLLSLYQGVLDEKARSHG